MSGLFGYAAADLEAQVRALNVLVSGLLELVEPGLIVENIDPYSGQIRVTLPNPARPDGSARIFGYGMTLAQAVDQARAQVRSIAVRELPKSDNPVDS